MITKSITYTDYDGNERTEDFYFNLSEAELMEWELSKSGGLSKLYEKIAKEQNVPELIKAFKEIITKSYGEKSLDGKRFIKSPELTEQFTQTEAYSNLFMELLNNTESAIAFTNGIIPDKAKKAADIQLLEK